MQFYPGDLVRPARLGWDVATIDSAWLLGTTASFAIVIHVPQDDRVLAFFPEHMKLATIGTGDLETVLRL